MRKADLNGKNILVTGGSGFIGSNFIEMILREYVDMNVVNVDNLMTGSRKDFVPFIGNNNTYEHNYQTTWAIAEDHMLGKWMFDYIFHFAAESHVDRSITNPAVFMVSNVAGMAGVVEYMRNFCPKTTRLINISTDEVYGHLPLDGHDYFTELSPLQPRSPYSASKASADLIAGAYFSTYGLDIITTRCCNNFGKHQHDEKLIPTVVRHLVQGRKVPVYGKGENIREWISVDDHNRSILEIADIGVAGNVYNVTGEMSLTNIEMIATILGIIHPMEKFPTSYLKFVEFITDRKGHDLRYSLESIKYKRSFELESFYGSLRNTVDFYVDKYESADK